ncbi:MAG: arylsulfatase [Halioglobus sp.]|nr:arylsulfatase [Halioglobus sp.]
MTQLSFKIVVTLALATLALGIGAQQAEKSRPNFLLIVADDLAYTDLGVFGGEIATPNLDALADKGVKFTSFYTAPTCSPSRAMLLTGQDAHKVGLGTMAEALHEFPFLAGQPGYEGHLDRDASTIAGLLGAGGYRTMMVGKWHLGFAPQHSPKAFGFQKSFVLLQGGADHFGADQGEPGSKGRIPASYQEDGTPARYPVGRYSTEFYTDKILEYLEREPGEKRPFFAYLAYTAPHWPVQAPENLIDKYKGMYAGGPNAMQRARLARLKELGLLNENLLTTGPESLLEWDKLSAGERAQSARLMEVYAAMVDSLDQNVGRVLAALEKSGELDNTVIIFMSDNGAEGLAQAGLERYLGPMGYSADRIAELTAANADPEKIGRPGSFATYGPGWAQASTGPFRLFKGATNEGGVRTPAFVSGAGVSGGPIYRDPVSVRDIFPTLLELAGVQDPTASDAVEPADLPAAISWVPMLDDDPATTMASHTVLGWEFIFRRAIRQGNWKAVFSREEPAVGGAGPGEEPPRWRLYDLGEDLTELHDLAGKHPAVLEGLVSNWNRYAQANGVVASPPARTGNNTQTRPATK